MRLIAFILFFNSWSAFASPSLESWADLFRSDLSFYQDVINSSKGDPRVKSEAFVQVIWDKTFDSEKKEAEKKEAREEARLSLQNLEGSTFSVSQKLKLLTVAKELGVSLSFPLEKGSQWNRSDYLTYFSLLENYPDAVSKISLEPSDLYESVQKEFLESTIKDEWTGSDIASLLNYNPQYRGGFRGYKSGVRLYMFCRHNREHPCLMLMKNPAGDWVKNPQGKIWSQPKLGMSRQGLPSHQTNGETPQGVYTIDSVMPEANRQLVFGKYRRLILNFISPSSNERELLSLIPSDVGGLNWWKQSVVARDVGRALLRIHGTGIPNIDPQSAWYPFYPTSGCVASRENTYAQVSYHDQRELLDTMMVSMGLSSSYENETALKGLLYVVNIDSQERAVEEDDIFPFL